MFGITWLDETIWGIPHWILILVIVFCFIMWIKDSLEDNEETKMTKDEEEDEEAEEGEVKCDECGEYFEDTGDDCECSGKNCKKKICEDCAVTCDECDYRYCSDCIVEFGNSNICKDCINKEYPREVEYKERIVTKEVPVEKVVYLDKEGKTVEKPLFNPSEKTEFD